MKLAQLLTEGLEQDYYIAKTTDSEVKELLLRGHYLGAWPFAGSQYKDFIYGIYLRKTSKQLGLVPLLPSEESLNDDTLIGCIVYGYPEFHASSYVSKWIRSLLNPDDSIEDIYQNIRAIVDKDREEERKAKERGYAFRPKGKMVVHNILNATNVQDKQILELKRLFILPKFDLKNIESFAISKGNKEIFDNNPTIQAIVSFSDSRVGHHGGVYQATNAIYAGINKPGLHRYVYPRDTLAATIKKYQRDYEKLVYQYPKPKVSKKSKPGINDYPVDMSKRERAVSRYLKDQLPKVSDASLKMAITKVLDMIEKSPQKTFHFKEVQNMLIREMICESVIKCLNEGSSDDHDEAVGRKWGLKDLLSDTERDISQYSQAFQKGYKQIQREKKWDKWNDKITNWLGQLGSSLTRR